MRTRLLGLLAFGFLNISLAQVLPDKTETPPCPDNENNQSIDCHLDKVEIQVTSQQLQTDELRKQTEALRYYILDQQVLVEGHAPKGWVQPTLATYETNPHSYLITTPEPSPPAPIVRN